MKNGNNILVSSSSANLSFEKYIGHPDGIMGQADAKQNDDIHNSG